MMKIFRNIGELYKETCEACDCLYGNNSNKMTDIFIDIKDWFVDLYKNQKEIYRRPIRNINHFFNNLKRSTKWFFRMWNNYDWDHEYLIDMIVFKLKDMRYTFDYVEKHVDLRHQPSGEFIGEDSDSDLLTVDNLEGLDRAIALGEKIRTYDYVRLTPEIEKWHDEHSFFTDRMPEDMHNTLMEIYERAEIDEKNDRDEFFNLIRDNHLLWWS